MDVRHHIKALFYYLGYRSHVTKLFAKSATAKNFQLLYHQIVDHNSTFLDKGPVVHHRLEDFEHEISFLKYNYRIIGMDEFADTINTCMGSSRPSVVITFDDGYLDNYTLAYPILKKYQVPAVVYITTGLIGSTAMTWPDQIEYALLNTQKRTFCLTSLWGDELLSLQSKAQKKLVNVRIAQALKEVSDAVRKCTLKELFTALGVDPSTARERKMLNWDEIREMAANGIEFGAHSHSHPILSRVPLEEAKRDILFSKTILEEQLGKPVRHFAYPNGRSEDFTDELRDYCYEIGFDTVSTVLYGANYAGATDLYAVKRIGARSPVWMMAGEMLRLLFCEGATTRDNRDASC
jgi:peptidoglycan/xylan/chitin deacetylase (PgdA/CDA1 family)